MSCRVLGAGSGYLAVRCGRRRPEPCSVPGCTAPHAGLCDAAVVRAGIPGTCDRRLCQAHRAAQGDGRDLCPAHARLLAGGSP